MEHVGALWHFTIKNNMMMDKEDVIYVHITCGVHTHTHTHTVEYYSVVKNEILPPKVGGLRGYYAK